MNNVHFRSEKQTRETPAALFERLHREFGFTLDVCALSYNAQCDRYLTPEQDGLSQDWSGVCWMNPPYGSEISAWMQKAYESSRRGCTVVCLVPARVDTEWWHRFAVHGEIRFLRGRLRFVGANSSAPFPSAIVIFRDRWWERRDW
jgi:phage N-6-adenine-methyltransferase